jgi:ribosomal protein S18 acetylase RimI-like enzyme
VTDPLCPDEADEAVAFIAGQQADARSNVAYVGTEAAGIAAELGGLAPPWVTTARLLRSPGGPGTSGGPGAARAIAGVVVVEWDAELGRAWVLGPWAAAADGPAGDAAWRAAADELLDAALAQPPAEVTRHEMSGDVANARLAALAASRGWWATEPNHVLVADADVVAAWDAAEPAAPGGPGERGLRGAMPDDVAAIEPLHDAEFPGTYASARQLVDGGLDGSLVVLVAEVPDASGPGGVRVAGYAAGRVHEDGEGFIDFVVVEEAARGAGVGRRLVTAVTRRLLARSPRGRVALTVQDHRAPARALYRRLGFRPDSSLVAYRDWTP